jgi:hypothetical protein
VRTEDGESGGLLGRYGGGMLRTGDIGSAPGVRGAGSAADGDWFVSGLLPMDRELTRVGSIIPPVFPCYARVLHPAAGGGGGRKPRSWKDVATWSGRRVHAEMQWEVIREPLGGASGPPPWEQPPKVGQAPLEVRRRLVSILEGWTERADACRVLVWTGWGGFSPDATIPGAPRVRTPTREYALFEAPLSVLAGPLVSGPGAGEVAGPSVWWPADCTWCVATEIDFRWTYVAGARECIGQILADPQLEALETNPQHRGDMGSDTGAWEAGLPVLHP